MPSDAGIARHRVLADDARGVVGREDAQGGHQAQRRAVDRAEVEHAAQAVDVRALDRVIRDDEVDVGGRVVHLAHAVSKLSLVAAEAEAGTGQVPEADLDLVEQRGVEGELLEGLPKTIAGVRLRVRANQAAHAATGRAELVQQLAAQKAGRSGQQHRPVGRLAPLPHDEVVQAGLVAQPGRCRRVGACAVVGEAVGHAAQGGRAQQPGQADLGAQALLDQPVQPSGEQRVPAEHEEVVVRRLGRVAEHLASRARPSCAAARSPPGPLPRDRRARDAAAPRRPRSPRSSRGARTQGRDGRSSASASAGCGRSG